MSRVLKFRAWDSATGKVSEPFDVKESWGDYLIDFDDYSTDGALDSIIFEQYTGLIDKNGKEIYENCELDGRYRVEYIAPKFVGKDMIKGDIIELYDNKFTITKEHCEISQNSERGIN